MDRYIAKQRRKNAERFDKSTWESLLIKCMSFAFDSRSLWAYESLFLPFKSLFNVWYKEKMVEVFTHFLEVYGFQSFHWPPFLSNSLNRLNLFIHDLLFDEETKYGGSSLSPISNMCHLCLAVPGDLWAPLHLSQARQCIQHVSFGLCTIVAHWFV